VQLDKEKPGTGNIKGLNLAAVKPTSVRWRTKAQEFVFVCWGEYLAPGRRN
jgi:hypothetical protein